MADPGAVSDAAGPPQHSPLPAPPPEALSSTLASSTAPSELAGVPLDAVSWAHIVALTAQSLRCCKVIETTWKEPLMTMLRSFDEYLKPALLETLAESKLAQADAAGLAREHIVQGGVAGRRAPTGLRAWLSGAVRHDEGDGQEAPDYEKREKRRARWRDAAMLLRSPQTEEPPLDRHVREGTFADWTEVEEAQKISLLQLRVKAVETTLGAVKAGTATLGVSFMAEEWEGEQLFGVSEPDLEDEDLKFVERHGGTFRLTSTPRELARLQRILELLVFAVVALKLEVQLLHDLACPHPSSTADPAPHPSSPPYDAPPSQDDYQNDSDIPLPGAYRIEPTDEPTEEWRVPNRWKRSAAGASRWLQLVLPHPDLGRRRSLRRSSTRYSTVHSLPPPTSPTFASSRQASVNRSFGRMRDKAKGFGLRLRKRASKSQDVALHKAATIGTEGAEEEGWDFLGGFGLGFLAPTRDKDKEEEEAAPQPTPEEVPMRQPQRFEKVVQDLAEFLLSVSPGVLFPPPHLLFRLRQQELLAADQPLEEPGPASAPPAINVNGDVQLPPRLGALHQTPSFGTEAFALDFATGMATPSSELPAPSQGVVPSASAARIALDAKAGLASLLTNNSSLAGSFRHQAMQFLVQVVRTDHLADPPCEPPQWITLAFFQDGTSAVDHPTGTDDPTLGSFVKHVVQERDRLCECGSPKHAHAVVLMHQRERIEISLSTVTDSTVKALATSEDDISSWTTCRACNASTSPARLTSAASAYSLAKYLELLLYDTNFVPSPELCEHARDDRTALVRCFTLDGTTVEFKLGTIALFELRLPTAVDPDVELSVTDGAEEDPADSHPLEELSLEINAFFNSVDARLDELEQCLTPPSPRLESSELDIGVGESEHRGHSRSTSQETVAASGRTSTLKGGAAADSPSATTLELLSRLRDVAHVAEGECRHAADTTDPNRLNEARFVFESQASALKLRLEAWQTKHAPALAAGSGPEALSPLTLDEPEYFKTDVHAFPVGSSVLVRDGELSSLIALALSAAPFHDAVASSEAGGTPIATPTSFSGFAEAQRRTSGHHLPIPAEFLDPSAVSTSAASATPPRSPLRQSVAHADPDDPDAVFAAPAEVEVIAKWRKAPRATSGSMFRNIVRKRSGETGSLSSSSASSPLLRASDHAEHRESRLMPLSDSLLDDFLRTPDAPVPKTKHLRALPSIISGLAAKRDPARATPVCDVLATGVSSPRTSVFSGSAAGTIRSIASSRFANSESESNAASLTASTDDEAGEPEEGDVIRPMPASPAPLSGSRLLGNRFDGFFSGWDTARSTLGRLSPIPGWHEGGGETDESVSVPTEHIKLKFRQGSKTYRVTSYYEKRFRALRAKCGLSESLFIESLTRCTDLNPSGGKSSAAFLLTGDQRFMLKELVTKLGYSELTSLLDFAPKLLTYLMAPERPSLLAKIFGIYTVKISDAKTGKKRKVDLILMEHLFASKTISRQFDLKGIASRVAKPKMGAATKDGTGWDGDWLTGSLQNQLLIYPHSKTLLRDALTNDVHFLSSGGGIDFSLLVGVDDTHSELVVGLIDTLGVFNTLKVLEHHTKAAVRLATASDPSSITVQPPVDYAKRFLIAMEHYFISVPDKWTRPPGSAALDPDPRLACPL